MSESPGEGPPLPKKRPTRRASAYLHTKSKTKVGVIKTMMQDTVERPRIQQLKELLLILAKEIDEKPGARDMASLARQYRETLQEIEEIEGTDGNNDEISQLLQERERDGKSGSVR